MYPEFDPFLLIPPLFQDTIISHLDYFHSTLKGLSASTFFLLPSHYTAAKVTLLKRKSGFLDASDASASLGGDPWASNEKRLVQDGGVEGRALTPSCENTGITTNC